MNENREFRTDILTKWLRVLMYVAVASLLNAVINFLPVIPASVTTWISRGITVAAIVCMFQLAPLHERYRKAAIYRAVMLGCTLISNFLFASSILTLVASVFSILAVYQEYTAHAELVADKDSKLSANWHSLFVWGIIAGVLIGFGSVVAVLFVTMLKMDAVRATTVIVGVLSIPQLIVEVLYVLYLRKMVGIFQNEGEVY